MLIVFAAGRMVKSNMSLYWFMWHYVFFLLISDPARFFMFFNIGKYNCWLIKIVYAWQLMSEKSKSHPAILVVAIADAEHDKLALRNREGGGRAQIKLAAVCRSIV